MFKIYRNFFLVFLFVIIANTSCKKGGNCEGAMNVNQSEVVVTFIDQQSGNYLYSEINPMYNKDSLKVFDPQGSSLVILKALRIDTATLIEYWDISFGNIYDNLTDQASFNSMICKDYIIMYSFNETDTVRVCFKSKKTKCGSVFETLKVFHKSQLISSEINTTSTLVTIYKN